MLRCAFGLEISTEDTPCLGIAVLSVRKGGAAEQAGIKLHEYIKEIDGHYISSNIAFEERALHRTPGDSVDMQVARNHVIAPFNSTTTLKCTAI